MKADVSLRELAENQTALRLDEFGETLAESWRLPSEDHVHALRVSSRRLQSALKAFKPVLGKSKRIRSEVRLLMSSAAEVRSYDIAENLIAKSKVAVPPSLLAELAVERSRASSALQHVVNDLVKSTGGDRDKPCKRCKRWRRKLAV